MLIRCLILSFHMADLMIVYNSTLLHYYNKVFPSIVKRVRVDFYYYIYYIYNIYNNKLFYYPPSAPREMLIVVM